MRSLPISIAIVYSVCVSGAHAEEAALIWAPSKLSDTAYIARIGLRIPGYDYASTGVDLGVQSTVKGGPAEVPVRLWGQVKAASVKTAAYQLNRDIAFDLNAVTGYTSAQMGLSSKRIISPDLDMELKRSIAVSYDQNLGSWGGLNASQSIRWSNPNWGSAVLVSAGSADSLSHVTTTVAIEQKIGKRIKVTGQVDSLTGPAPRPAINARYSIRW